ncbi:TolB-like translocation protein [Streptomyces sp. NPDC059164]|uniref:TolB-like translocation protein n=1 Tax=Streptomyces sp. NPDC059164 TaxID=3346750 RepID=UPI00367A30FF
MTGSSTTTGPDTAAADTEGRRSTDRSRRIAGAVLVAALLAAAIGAVAWRRQPAAESAGPLRLERPGTVLLVAGPTHRVRQLDRTGRVLGSGPVCQRAATAAGVLTCLRALPGPMATELRVYRAGKDRPVLTLPVWGEPSRTRVSPSGRWVAWTVFRSGDSYAQSGQFSTTAGVYDLHTGAHHGSLEDYAVFVDGRPFHRESVNFWGVTFAADDRTFYATMAADGTTWLMRGDLRTRRLTALRRNVECPSLSPDGTRIAYKKRAGTRWRLHVLDLRRGSDTALAETADIDDQAAWLDGKTVGYAKPGRNGPEVFAVPADGSGAPRARYEGASPTITTEPAGEGTSPPRPAALP